MYNFRKCSRSVIMTILWICLVVVFISQTATSMVIAKDRIVNATIPRYINKEGGGGKTARSTRTRFLPVAMPVSSAKIKLGESNELEGENLEIVDRANRVRRDDDFNEQAEGYSSDYAYEEIVKKSYKKKRLIFFTGVFCQICWWVLCVSLLKALIMFMV
ncbi:uncharacterized protein [Asterias amurensis]|uniref:uncharacterized protein n=1 Tax=Asterias amurensis TaxID=7602 RepID=UPI003AB26798